MNPIRQHPDENRSWGSNTATYCDSSGYIHNLKFFLIPLSKSEFLSNYQTIALFIFFREKENEPKEIAPVMRPFGLPNAFHSARPLL
ncbi:hypothetical protein C6A37_05200 [Desulfobacteraceae bacterium SEEP-SAG9]|nr:hypothetical protein C6A37_05200 [Desulfobacteraceae bacterium SEEP-SAG9]